MAWPESANTVVMEQGDWSQPQYRVFGGNVNTYHRIHTRTVTEYRGGTYAEAVAYQALHPAGTGNVVSSNAIKDGAVWWKVVIETDDPGEWTEDA